MKTEKRKKSKDAALLLESERRRKREGEWVNESEVKRDED